SLFAWPSSGLIPHDAAAANSCSGKSGIVSVNHGAVLLELGSLLERRPITYPILYALSPAPFCACRHRHHGLNREYGTRFILGSGGLQQGNRRRLVRTCSGGEPRESPHKGRS